MRTNKTRSTAEKVENRKTAVLARGNEAGNTAEKQKTGKAAVPA